MKSKREAKLIKHFEKQTYSFLEFQYFHFPTNQILITKSMLISKKILRLYTI